MLNLLLLGAYGFFILEDLHVNFQPHHCDSMLIFRNVKTDCNLDCLRFACSKIDGSDESLMNIFMQYSSKDICTLVFLVRGPSLGVLECDGFLLSSDLGAPFASSNMDLEA